MMKTMPPKMTSSSDSYIVQSSCPFADSEIENAVWMAMKAVWGNLAAWDKHTCMFSRQFLSAMQGVTVETLSFRDLKARVDTQVGKVRLHRVLWMFLCIIKNLYHAEDETAFHELVGRLQRAGDSYSILFDAGVSSFSDIAYVDYYKQHNYFVVRTENPVLKRLYREAMMHSTWSFAPKPTQARLDRLFRFIDDATNLHPVNRIEDFDIPFLYDLMDELNRQGRAGVLSPDDRHLLIVDIIHLIRYCIRHYQSVTPCGMIEVPEILYSREAVKFFLSEYVSRDLTFVFNRRYGSPQSGVLVTLNIDNVALRAAYSRLLRSGKVSDYEFWMCKDTLVESLGRYADTIGLPGVPFSEDTFRYQVDFYRKIYKDSNHRSEAIAFVKFFYLSIDEQGNGAFFREAHTLTYRLLTSHSFVRYSDMGFTFRRYSAFDRVTEGKRIVFLVSGMNKYRKKMLSEDHIAVDFSCIKDADYRSVAWRAVTSSTTLLCRPSFVGMLRDMLPFLSRLKASEGYRFPQRNIISAWDAMFIAEYYRAKLKTVSTYNYAMMDVRAFLRWARESKAFVVDMGAFKALVGRKTKHNPTNTPVVSDEALTQLMGYFAKRAKNDPVYGQALVLLNLCIITPLRIGHTCSLLHEELEYNEHLGSYIVTSSSKGTKGGITEIVLGGRADDFVRKAVRISEKVGMDCHQEDMRRQLFLYEFMGKYRVFTPKKFGQLMNEACEHLHLPHYTAKNLRATYMTKAYVEASANGYANEFVLKLFSYHKNAGTTLENYVNHSEALASLTDFIKRGNDWKKTIYPDERAALKEVVDVYVSLINTTEDETVKDRLRVELRDYEKQLEALN